MSDDKLAELLKTQKSLTEWLEEIKHSDAARLRTEDNEKRERLKILNEVINLPFDKPTQFDASELRDDNPNFRTFLQQRGDELCALRLMPKKDDLPKLRIRGKTINSAYEWFKEQEITPSDYKADFVPHADSTLATIFIVNKFGVQGEIIHGGHHQLTQGFHDGSAPTVFRYDFKTWNINPHNDEALEHLKMLAELIHVSDQNKQKELQEKLGATFEHDYLKGYFETTQTALGTWYIDYSPVLGEIYSETIVRTDMPKTDAAVTGQTGSSGKATGQVCIVDPDNIDIAFPDNGILVCKVTTPKYIPLMQKARAIVTDQGGILSHAAIVARELHKPCIVGTGQATTKLKNGQIISVDADAGTVTF